MNRQEFQKISKLRVKEARILLNASQYAGAYYLVGYAVECALKAHVAKQFKRHDIPRKDLINQVFSHDLTKLMRLAGLASAFAKACKANKNLELNWAVVKDWSVDKRYEIGITSNEARDIYSACTARKNGVLPWIKKQWNLTH